MLKPCIVKTLALSQTPRRWDSKDRCEWCQEIIDERALSAKGRPVVRSGKDYHWQKSSIHLAEAMVRPVESDCSNRTENGLCRTTEIGLALQLSDDLVWLRCSCSWWRVMSRGVQCLVITAVYYEF